MLTPLRKLLPHTRRLMPLVPAVDPTNDHDAAGRGDSEQPKEVERCRLEARQAGHDAVRIPEWYTAPGVYIKTPRACSR